MLALYTNGRVEYGLTDRPVPEPAADECLVRVSRASICHTDVIIRDGAAGHVHYPFVPGHEFAGIVEQRGSTVRWLASDHRVAVCAVMGSWPYTCCRCGEPNRREHHCVTANFAGALEPISTGLISTSPPISHPFPPVQAYGGAPWQPVQSKR
jgi:D-arabinose 1-dehydrogenase-like Zn-dependent alcohol dehydrogenase